MFADLEYLAPDPILGVTIAFRADPTPNKVDLGVGVYRDARGQTPIPAAVREAEGAVLSGQTSKTYVGPLGNAEFNQRIAELALGPLMARLRERVARLLVTEGALRRVGDALVLGEALDGLKAEVRKRWPSGSRLDVGAFKDLTRLSRKYVIPLLEYLDREKITRRSGPDRVVM